MPARAAAPPRRINVVAWTLDTFMPAKRAASWLPPVANTLRPKRVRVSKILAIITTINDNHVADVISKILVRAIC